MFNQKPERIRPVPRSVSRRGFLAAGSVVVGLPLLESLTSRVRIAQAQQEEAGRLLVYYFPNGNVPDINGKGWVPTSTGPDYTLPDTLQPLSAVRDKMLVLSRMNNSPALPQGNGGHMSGTGGFLVCRRPDSTGAANVGGPSMDQLYAESIAGSARIRSLALGTDTTWGNDPPWSTEYPRNISWTNGTTPAGRIVDPPEAFDRIFEGVDTSGAAQAAPATTPTEPTNTFDRAAARVSVLDQVTRDAESLRGQLNAGDQAKLEEYLEGVRQLETEVQGLVMASSGGGTMTATPAGCTSFDRPTQSHSQLRSQIDVIVGLMNDIIFHAFLCNSTRVISFMTGNGSWDESMSQIGVNSGHHAVSHHARDPNNLATLQQWERYMLGLAAPLFERMNSVDEGNGRTMLDNTLTYVGNEIGDGDYHDQTNKLTLLLGGSAAGLQQGTHLAMGGGGNQFGGGGGREHAEMYVAMLQGLGMDISSFGSENKGPLLDIQA